MGRSIDMTWKPENIFWPNIRPLFIMWPARRVFTLWNGAEMKNYQISLDEFREQKQDRERAEEIQQFAEALAAFKLRNFIYLSGDNK